MKFQGNSRWLADPSHLVIVYALLYLSDLRVVLFSADYMFVHRILDGRVLFPDFLV